MSYQPHRVTWGWLLNKQTNNKQKEKENVKPEKDYLISLVLLVCVHACKHACMCVCVHVCACVCVCMHGVHACMRVRACMYVSVCLLVCMMCVCVCVYMTELFSKHLLEPGTTAILEVLTRIWMSIYTPCATVSSWELDFNILSTTQGHLRTTKLHHM